MNKDYNLFENYEWFGSFWFEDDTASENKPILFSGKLTYSPISGVMLEIISCVDHYWSFNKDKGRELYHIFGIVNGINGLEKISLYKCQASPSSCHYGIGSTIRFFCTYLVIGRRHFESGSVFLDYKVNFLSFSNFVHNNTNLDSILNFNLQGGCNVNVVPSMFIKDQTLFFPYPSADEDDNSYSQRKQKLLNLQVHVNEELRKLNGAVITKHTYIFEFKDNDKKGYTINKCHNYIQDVRNIFSLLLNKNFYVEDIYFKDSNDNNAFIFGNFNSLNQEQLNSLHRSKTPGNPFSIASITTNHIEKLNSLIKDNSNNRLINYLLDFINKTNTAEDRLIIIKTILEEEFNFLKENNIKKTSDQDHDYSIIMKEYAPFLTEEFLNILIPPDSVKKYKHISEEIKEILNNNLESNIFYILDFLRNKITHNKANDLKIKGLKDDIKSQYKEYLTNNLYVLVFFVNIISILLFAILYTKTKIPKDLINHKIRLLEFEYTYNLKEQIEHFHSMSEKLNS
jgi:hypothetical protein